MFISLQSPDTLKDLAEHHELLFLSEIQSKLNCLLYLLICFDVVYIQKEKLKSNNVINRTVLFKFSNWSSNGSLEPIFSQCNA